MRYELLPGLGDGSRWLNVIGIWRLRSGDSELARPVAMKRRARFGVAALLLAGLLGATARPALPQMIGPCPTLPADNIWNTRVDSLPVDPSSSAYITSIGPTRSLHPDFGSGLFEGAPIGIPYVLVPGTQPLVPITFDFADESDPGPYPIPPNAPIEGGPSSTGDRHVLVVDQDNCKLYEVYAAYPQGDGSWQAGSGALFNLRSNALRPETWTSADAAGLPILPGLARYAEVAAGAIRHALRFTAPLTRQAYVWPARHFASSNTDPSLPPMGQRFRLKASFNISTFSTEVQVILQALKTYGMMLADNGSAWFISGAPDPGWNDSDLVSAFQQVHGSDFEAVDVSSLLVYPDSGQTVATRFADVPADHWARTWVERLANAGVTAGCGTAPPRFCPDDAVTREQMAVFLLRAREGSTYTPTACTTAPFSDVPSTSPFCPWIQELAARGVTGGCGQLDQEVAAAAICGVEPRPRWRPHGRAPSTSLWGHRAAGGPVGSFGTKAQLLGFNGGAWYDFAGEAALDGLFAAVRPATRTGGHRVIRPSGRHAPPGAPSDLLSPDPDSVFLHQPQSPDEWLAAEERKNARDGSQHMRLVLLRHPQHDQAGIVTRRIRSHVGEVGVERDEDTPLPP